MQRALLDIHFMMLLEELTHPKFLRLGKICASKVSRKIRSPVKRSRILPLVYRGIPFPTPMYQG